MQNTYTSKAIQLAIEKGGYWSKLKSEITNYRIQLPTASQSVILDELLNKYGEQFSLLDPLFWQALGKALGWRDYVGEFDHGSSCGFHGGMDTFSFDDQEWKLRWLQFIHHLAENKDPDSFFQEILNK